MILVFKTNVLDISDAQILYPVLAKHLANTVWTFDLEDRDKILRIDSPDAISGTIVRLLNSSGYECEELTD